ncbi:hypothetical protein T265_10070 [Opisthorchis viverrini]|uniref:Uncharacterized protein n=1 Tax=Opisthorchis viverrini TaxID=6198 RepID=A0A074Z3Q4_OPIVI|nr:hypothetical protein T265_10070 [Opisthorchis viverrini]KER21648.1 hypothetical protein T265_10070 [Opisthorchis viverrini]
MLASHIECIAVKGCQINLPGSGQISCAKFCHFIVDGVSPSLLKAASYENTGRKKVFAAKLFTRICQLNNYRLLDGEAKHSYASCLQKLNTHLLMERIFLNFPGYSMTVTQIQANATKRLHKFRNRYHFSSDAKRIYKETYYSQTFLGSSITVTLVVHCRSIMRRVPRKPFLFTVRDQVGTEELFLNSCVLCKDLPKWLTDGLNHGGTVQLTKMSPSHSMISFAVLGTSLTLTIVALAMSAWDCGNLFTDCQETKFRSRIIGIAALLILAVACFILILIMDVLTFCNPSVSANLCFQIVYYALLLLGPMSHLAGVFIYTRETGRQWSYFLAVWASVMVVQAAWFVAIRKTAKINAWVCGNLFTSCQDTRYRSVASAVASVLLLGTLCLLLLIVMESVSLCRSTILLNRGFQISYCVLLAIGLLSLLTGVLVYTGEVGRQWSYLMTVCASVLAIQVAVMVGVGAICEKQNCGTPDSNEISGNNDARGEEERKMDVEKYTHSQITLIFTRDSTESLVYDVLQLNVLHTGRLIFQLVRYSRYRSIFSRRKLLTTLSKSFQQHFLGFCGIGILSIAIPLSFERSPSFSGAVILVSPHQRGHRTRYSLLLELISIAYPMTVPRFEPRTSSMRGECLTTTPPMHVGRLNSRTCSHLSNVIRVPESSKDDPVTVLVVTIDSPASQDFPVK